VPHRYAISAATVVMLVVLRLNIGWHFFSEGVKHYADPHWTSEAFLRGAKGPLAPQYQAYLPDFHGLDAWLHRAEGGKESHAVQGWLDEIQADWKRMGEAFSDHFELDGDQRRQVAHIVQDFQSRLRVWGADSRSALEAHVHQWQRAQATRGAPGGDEVPFQKQRAAVSQGTLVAEAEGWRSQLKTMEQDYERALDHLLTDRQHQRGPMARPTTSIDLVDTTMTCVIMAIGLLVLLGLFTRAACLAGAVFLLSVVLTQPFWISDTRPTFNEFVELFALLLLATTHVGRWAGLDFFVHILLFVRRRSEEKQSHVSQP